jgi:hypothetical protein
MSHARITLSQLREIAQVPKDARLVDIEYVSEPDGSLPLYSNDGDENASIHVSWEKDERSDAEHALLEDIASAMRLHGYSRISLKYLQVDQEGVGYTAGGVSLRVLGTVEGDESDDL